MAGYKPNKCPYCGMKSVKRVTYGKSPHTYPTMFHYYCTNCGNGI